MNTEKEFLAEECGIDYDEYMSRDFYSSTQRNKALESRIKQLAAQKFGKDAITKKLVSEYGYYQVMDFLRDNPGILVYLLLQEYSREIK